MSKKNIDLTIILPIFNPHEGWNIELSQSLLLISQALNNINYQFVIVNDGSVKNLDAEIIVIKESIPNINYYSYDINKGKGYAIRYGMKLSLSEYYIYTDVDFPFGEKAVIDIYNLLKTSKYDLIIGLRDKSYYLSLPYSRKVISKSVQLFNYFITGFKIKDTQAGIKGLNHTIKDIFLSTKTNGYIFELEFIRKCLKNKVSYSLIDVKAKEGIKFSTFKPKTIFKEIKNVIKLLLIS